MPKVVEEALDYLTMQTQQFEAQYQQLQGEVLVPSSNIMSMQEFLRISAFRVLRPLPRSIRLQTLRLRQ